MKIKLILGKTLLVGLILIMSCTNLEEELFSDIPADDFLKTEEEFTATLGSAYTSFNNYMGEGWTMQEVSSDEMVVPTRGQDWNDNGNWVRLHQHQYRPNDDRVQGAWREIFRAINNANRVIFQFEESGNATAQEFISELKVLRAMEYWWLLDLYGNVPIVDRFDVPADFAPANNTRQEVFNFVEKEILENVDNLSKANDQSDYGRMNYYGGQALLAKLYLNAEVYTGTPRWDDAIAAADNIINSGVFSLEDDYFANFAAQNEGSLENIYVLVYDQVFSGGMNINMRTLHYQSQNTFNFTAQPWNGYCSMAEFYASYEENDDRKASFLVGPQVTASGEPLNDSGYEKPDESNPDKPVDPDGERINFTPEINELAPNALRQAGARVNKYEYELGATQNMNNDLPIFRYGDILLVKAEALWRKNPADAEALALVNQIRMRAGVEPFSSLTAENLLAERGREVFAEGYRRQDLIRFGKYNDAWWAKPASDPTKNIFPIPQEQLNSNPNLEQNPGY